MKLTTAGLELVPGDPLAWPPRLDVPGLSVLAGPYRDGAEHEKHVLATTGSGNWYQSEGDELRFDPDTGELASFWLHIPETNLADGDRLAPFLDLTPEPGTVHLAEPRRFDLPPVDRRWCPPSGELLAGVHDSVRGGEPRRVRVAPDFDLLIEGGTLAGWLLAGPARYGTRGWAPPGDNPPALAPVLADVFATVAYPNTELMQDQDTGVRDALRG